MDFRSGQMADDAQVIALWRVWGLVILWNDPQRNIRLKARVQTA